MDQSMAAQTLTQTISLIREDISFRCEYENKQLTLVAALKLMLNPGMVVVVAYRLQKLFNSYYLYPLSWLMSLFSLLLFSVQIHSGARIQGGLVLIHADSVFIGKEVLIGKRCILFHQNSIGGACFATETNTPNAPVTTIGNNVIFGAGSCAYGNISIGDGCKLAVNTVVDADTPPNSVLFGVPARIVSKSNNVDSSEA
jgi:serine acetyltransferase